APRAWFHRFVTYAIKVRFSPSKRDSSLFIYKCGTDKEFLLIYVDDIVLTTSSTALLQNIILSLHKEFEMTDLGALNYFLGISITRDTTGIFLSQNKYAMDILERAHALNCNPTRTPVDTKSKLGPEGILALWSLVYGYMHLQDLLLWLTLTLIGLTLSRSSAEDEYRGVVNVVVETSWLRNLLRELHTPLLTATLVYCDNVSAVYLSANLVQHQ
ncbi:ribonuclease H-like domain-containing protein, partial [Tanacetum coccineum]